MSPKVCERCGAVYGPRPAEHAKLFEKRRYCSRSCTVYARSTRTREFVARLEKGPATFEDLMQDVYAVPADASERARDAARVRVRSMIVRARAWVAPSGRAIEWDGRKRIYRLVAAATAAEASA